MNQDLLRQRRNLIAVSAFLILFDIAGVQVSKVSLLGNELIVGNVEVLIYGAWCLWGYFLLRYYQYWRTEPEQLIRSTFRNHLQNLIRTYGEARDCLNQNRSACFAMRRTGLLSWSISMSNAVVTGDLKETGTLPLPLWRLFSWYMNSAFHVVLQTPYATDRVLPFLIAIAAPIVVVWKKFPTPWPWIWDLNCSLFCA